MSQHNPGPSEGNDGQLRGDDYVPAAPLSPADLTSLRQSLAHQQRRRLAYRAGPLRAYWDGAERRKVDLQVGGGEPFRVPLSASYLDVVGDDAEGALLLGVCPLPDPDAVSDEGGSYFSVTLEGGHDRPET